MNHSNEQTRGIPSPQAEGDVPIPEGESQSRPLSRKRRIRLPKGRSRDFKVLFFLLMFPAIAHTQVYYDAVDISKEMGMTGKVNIQSPEILTLLSPYVKTANATVTLQEVAEAFEGNPFIQVSDGEGDITKKVVFEYGTENIGGDEGPRIRHGDMPNSPLSVTAFADGLAKFLVKRTKQELNEAFFRKFQEKMENSQARLDLLFPRTHGTLTLIGTDIYRFNAFIETLRAGFLQDLEVLDQNAERWLLSEEVARLFKEENKYALAMVADVARMAGMVKEGEKAVDFIAYLSEDAHFNDLDLWPDKHEAAAQKFQSSVELLERFSDALRSRESDRTWVEAGLIKELKSNDRHFHLFLGLLYQKIKNIHFGNKKIEGMVTENNIGDFIDLFVGIHDFFKSLEQMEGRMRKAPESIENSQNYALYGQYVSRVLSLVEMSLDEVALLGGLSDDELAKARLYLDATRDATDMGLSILQGEYGMAVLELADFIQTHINDEQDVKPFLVKYGAFMAAMVKAEDADQVAATIEAFALPSGSSSIKKYSEFNVSLNAFVGAYGGMEFLSEGNDWLEGELDGKGSMAFTSPVGVACSWGNPTRNHAHGVFVSLIDIGAITTFRFSDSDAELLPELSFNNIIAPGAYWMYHFGHDLPISLALGGQFGPNLRKITPDGAPEIQAQGFRIGATLAVDIPLMNVYTRPFELGALDGGIPAAELAAIEAMDASEKKKAKLKRLRAKYHRQLSRMEGE